MILRRVRTKWTDSHNKGYNGGGHIDMITLNRRFISVGGSNTIVLPTL